MPRYKKIVVGIDGSENGARALAAGVAMAKANRAKLHIAHGSNNDEAAALAVKEAKEAAFELGMGAEAEYRVGPPADVICEIADQNEADLIVVGSRGMTRAKRMLIGSVSFQIAHYSPCDVLIVRNQPRETDGPPYNKVLVATDGSATADRCARKGYDLGTRLKASMLLLFVGHPETGRLVLEDTKKVFEKERADLKISDPLQMDLRITKGDPADKILEVAEAEGVDLIVMGNKGITGTSRFLLGSVPQKVLHYSECDILIARTTTQVVTELDPGEGGVVKVDDRKLAVYRTPEGELIALSAKCTHLGCTVAWNPAGTSWDCPCHGSRFSPTGEVISGPATEPLARTDL